MFTSISKLSRPSAGTIVSLSPTLLNAAESAPTIELLCISTSARGHVPDDRALALQRAEDELVRRALARGCDRDLVGSVFGVTRRNTFHKQYRAAAYAFPLDEFNRGGRPVKHDGDSDDADEATDQPTAQEPADKTVGGNEDETGVPDGDLGRVETWGGTADEPGTPMSEFLHDDDTT